MSVVAKCPECERQVTIPDGVDPEVSVRCPLCNAEYPLSEAMATAPPELVPVAAIGDGISSAAGPETGTEQPVEAQQPVSDELQLDAWKKVDQAPQIDVGEGQADEEEVEVGEHLFARDESLDAAQPAGVAAPPRKRNPQASVLRQLVGTVLGGFLGLAIGYYLLNWYFGPRFDFLSIPLPGISHTYRHWPHSGESQADPNDQEESPSQPAADSEAFQRPGGQQPAEQDWPPDPDRPKSPPEDGPAERLFKQPAEAPAKPPGK